MLQRSSNQEYSLGDNLVPNAPQMNSPVAQELAVQSPNQLLDPRCSEFSQETMFENCLESPWLAREIERIPHNDLQDLLLRPVEDQSRRDDLIRQAKTESKEQDAAITKHLSKKAALEEKSKVWQLDSAASDSIVDSVGSGGNPLQSGFAIEKRIRELKESAKKQDVAIQKHITRKAFLEREIKLWQPKSENESGQPGDKLISETDEGDAFVSMPVETQPKEKPAQNDLKSNAKPLMPAYGGGSGYGGGFAYGRGFACGGGSGYGGGNARSTAWSYGSRKNSSITEQLMSYIRASPPDNTCALQISGTAHEKLLKYDRDETAQRSTYTADSSARHDSRFDYDMDNMSRKFEQVNISTGRSSYGKQHQCRRVRI